MLGAVTDIPGTRASALASDSVRSSATNSRDASPVGEHSFLGEPLPWQIQRLLEMGLSRELGKRPVSMEWVEELAARYDLQVDI